METMMGTLPLFERLKAMSIEECCSLTPGQRAAIAAEIAEAMEQGWECPALPNFQYKKREAKTGVIGSVYFLYAPTAEVVKIGFATHVPSRVAAIKAMSPVGLVLLGAQQGLTKAAESRLHRRFKPYRCHGEWFHCDREVRDFLKNHPCIKEMGGASWLK